MTLRAPRRVELHDRWQLQLERGDDAAPLVEVDIAAQVPGLVHVDLLGAALIDDPYLDRNEDHQHWIGRSDWRYTTTFEWTNDESDRVDLVFDGLDTIATISLDGAIIGRTANQHRLYRFDVTGLLTDGTHELSVLFAAPTNAAAALRDELGELPNPYGRPFNFIRKMACNYGWDWGPRLTTAGIWKPVAVEAWSHARLAAVRPSVDVADAEVGIVDLAVDLEWVAGANKPLDLVASVGGVEQRVEVAPGTDRATMHIEVPDIERWWPIGRGDQTLYDLAVRLDCDGAAVASCDSKVGFRSLRIDTTPVDDGSRWAFIVNGERVWARGTNWIPDDCFPTRVDRNRYEERIDQAIAANVNLLRIWGGGIYESDDFYELCDERGILVWQDFLFACAAYDEDAFRDEVIAEASDAIDRLMAHPSLVLWNGNNENIWGWWSWGWPDLVGDRSWGMGFYTELLPSIVAERDPNRPYLEGSPYSGDPSRHPNDQAHGPIHIWDVWNETDYLHYRSYQPRFVSEFGWQGPPTFATFGEGVTTRPLTIDDPDVLHHQKARDGHAKLARGMEPHFDQPADFDDWLYLTQLNQARAITVGVSHLRRVHDRCAGTIWWQLNDCWPVVSWAVIDGNGRRKPAWYALRSAYADRMIVVEPDGDGVAVFAVNDTRDRWDSTLTLRRVALDGTGLGTLDIDLVVEPDDAFKQLLPSSVCRAGDPRGELLVADVDGLRSVYSWNEDKELDLPVAAFTSLVSAVDPRTTEVTVTATTLLRDLCLFADRVDPSAETDTQLVTLLPGESHTFRVTSDVALDHDALVCRPALRCVNDA